LFEKFMISGILMNIWQIRRKKEEAAQQAGPEKFGASIIASRRPERNAEAVSFCIDAVSLRRSGCSTATFYL
jgi:hypothetical protein